MIVDMTVRVQIELDEDGVGDPAPGDPLEHRMLASAKEAVSNAVSYGESVGFEHDLASLTSVGFVDVQDCRRVDDAADGHWTHEDDQHPLENWRYEVANNDTRLGYREWVAAKREADTR